MEQDTQINVTLIGAGTIGLSFAASHLGQPRNCTVTIYDTRADIRSYISETLPRYIDDLDKQGGVNGLFASGRLRIASTLQDAVAKANIVQEQGPENEPFKQALWPEVEKFAPHDCLFWSSTSGIPASKQAERMEKPERLLVVHPYNPPHIMPLLEVVPAPNTDQNLIEKAIDYWKILGKVPVVLAKECTGFVANRLAFALLREAIHLVNEGVVTVGQADLIVENSMGPRWAIAGPFKSYHMGGGAGGLEGLMKNIGGTMQACWDDLGNVNTHTGWESAVFQQTKDAYGEVEGTDLIQRDLLTKELLSVKKKALQDYKLKS
ncbi:hypothetical protein F5884DRAFT_855524 [Xylogone sp. PMI_703]|nr:hypothetical protein F5884DRAFT_855524 [Xylogone sp. PMI_703]